MRSRSTSRRHSAPRVRSLSAGARAGCEALEKRLLLSTVQWNTTASGSWDVAANWLDTSNNTQHVPGAGDTVVINQPGDPTITINGSESIATINATGCTLVNNGTLTFGNTSDNNFNSSTLNNNGTINQTGGRLLLSSSPINNSSGATYDFQTDNGIFNNGGSNPFNNSGTVEKTVGSGNSEIGVPFNNAAGGEISVQNGTITLGAGGTSAGGTFNVASGAVLDLTGGSTNTFGGTYTGSGAGTVQLSGGTLAINGSATFDFPAGLFQWNGGALADGTLTNTGVLTLSGTNDKNLNSATLDNAATIDQAQGRLLPSSATVNNEPGATYDFQTDNGIFNNGGSNPFNNSGFVEKTAGTGNSQMGVPFFNVAGAQIDVQSGAIILGAGGTSSGGTFNVSADAVLDLTGGSTDTFGGTYTGTGAGTVQLSGGTLDINTSAAFDFPAGLFQWTGGALANGTLTNDGVINLNGTNDKNLDSATLVNAATLIQLQGRLLPSTGTIDNESGGTYDFETDNGIFNNGGANPFNNSGVVEKTAGSGTSTMGVPFNNVPGAQITVQTGNITLAAAGDNTGGTFNVSTGAVLDLTGGNTNTFTGSYGSTGAGTVLLAGGTLTTSTLGATFDFPASVFQWTGGALTGAGLTNNGVITLNGTNDKNLDGTTLTNNATIVQAQGRLLPSSGTINNTSSATYDFQTDNGIFNNGGGNPFNNSGIVEKTAGTGNSSIDAPFNNVPGAQVNVRTGSITLAGSGNSTGGTFNVSAGAVLDLTGGNTNNFTGSYGGAGPGVIQLASGTLNVGGNASFDFPAGVFQWSGGAIAGGTLANTGFFTLNGTNDKNLDSATLDNSGTVIQLQGRLLPSSGSIINESTGIWNFQTDNGIFNNGGANTFTNNGTILKSVGTGTSTLNLDVINNATIQVNTGTISLSGGFTEAASATIAIQIINQGAGNLTISGPFAIAGNLSIVLPSGFVPPQGNSYTLINYGSETGGFATINGLTGSGYGFTPTVGATSVTLGATTGGPPASADLALTNISYNATTYQPGEAFAASGTEENLGSGAAGPYSVEIVISSDQTFGDANNFVIQTINESGLSGGGTRSVSFSGTIPSTINPGNYYVLAKIDSGNVINETSYSNQLFISSTADVTVALPPPTPPVTPPPPAIPLPPPAPIGGLDPIFGLDGLASHDVGFTATNGLVIQPNGQSVILGTAGSSESLEFGLTRYNADGSLDTTFGTNGVAMVSFGGDDQPAALVLLSDGDILVAGTDTTGVGSQFALAEFTSAGVLDTSFGNGAGKVLTSFSTTAGSLSNDVANALAVAGNGTIYVGGTSNAANAGGTEFALAAYNDDGSADTAFGTNGTVLLSINGDDIIRALAIQSNGDIVAAGSTANSGGVTSVALARLLPSGALDRHFGSKGFVMTSVRGVFDAATSVAVDSTGKLVVGGLSATGSAGDGSLTSDFLVIRYTTTGAIDRTFGHGPVITSFGQPAAVSKVIITPTGDIVASGKTTASLAALNTSELDVAVAQYTSKGAPDSTFNGTGQAIFSLSSAGAAAAIVASAAAEDFAAASVSEFATIALQPSDASSLQQEFDAFEQSAQGVVAVTSGGELLDVGNSGVDTVEAEIVSSGVNLAARLSISLPQAVVGGAAGTASIQITEGGNIPASGTFTIDLYASPDPQIDQGLTAFQSFPEKLILKTGQSKTFRLKYAFPSGMANGNYYIVAFVDTGSVRDLDESNNIVASSSTVDIAAPFVDLAAADLSVSGSLSIGKAASISLQVSNAGNISAKATTAIEFLASTDGTVANGTMLASPGLHLSLKPGGRINVRDRIVIPSSLTAGKYFILALVDPSNVLNDPNLANNLAASASALAIGA